MRARLLSTEVGYRTSEAEQLLRAIVDARPAGAARAGAAVTPTVPTTTAAAVARPRVRRFRIDAPSPGWMRAGRPPQHCGDRPAAVGSAEGQGGVVDHERGLQRVVLGPGEL